MRIIAGEFRGRKLITPKGRAVRPTSDRAKETLLNVFTNRFDLERASVLELFCGTGAFGLECISRGAAHAIFVDIDIETVSKNIDLLGVKNKCETFRADSLTFLKRCKSRFDYVFADPPYQFEHYESLISGCLSVSDIVVIEHESDLVLTDDLKCQMSITRKVGRAVFTIFDKSTLSQ